MELTRLIRAYLRISQKRFGEMVGIPAWRISAIETGRPIKISEFTQIHNVLGNIIYHQMKPVIRIKLHDQNHERFEIKS